MNGSSVGEHVVIALLLVGARRHVAKVMDDARLSVEPSIGDNGATILTSKPV